MAEKTMTNDDLVSLVAVEFDNALGGPDSQLAKDRARAWDYYMQEPFGNEEEGYSQVVTSDVADVIDGVMPSLLRVFTTAENLVTFDPVGNEDVELARQETDALHYIFWKQNAGFSLLDTWCTDALMVRNAYVKCWWDESERITSERYQGLTESQLIGLLEDDELELVEQSERREETVDDDGVTTIEQVVHDVEFRRVTKRGQIRVEAVPADEVRISKDARKLDLSEARMIGHEREVTRDDLLAMRYDEDVIDKLPTGGETSEAPEKAARRDSSDEKDDGAPIDESQTNYLFREAFVKVDFDGDGRAERRRVVTVNGVLLDNETADRQPLHVLSPTPLPHKHNGRSLADRAMDVQLVSSTLVRQSLDNLYRNNTPQHGVWEQGVGESTMQDLLSPEIGKVVRFSRPVSESYQPMTVPFTAGASFAMLEWFEKAKRDRTGISADSEGLSPAALKNIQQTVLAQATDLSRMKIEVIARRFAETGLKSLFLHMHELMVKHRPEKQIRQLRGRFIPIDPQAWRERTDLTVTVGMGVGTREQNLLHLESLWNKLRDIVGGGGGGTIVTPKNVFNLIAEIVRNSGLKDPSLFVTDGGDFAPQDDTQTQLLEAQMHLAGQQQALEVSKHQLAEQKAQAEHARDLARVELQRQAETTKLLSVQNDFTVKLEQIANQLTELELKFGRDVPGAKV